MFQQNQEDNFSKYFQILNFIIYINVLAFGMMFIIEFTVATNKASSHLKLMSLP
jgi:hypothetical protein